MSLPQIEFTDQLEVKPWNFNNSNKKSIGKDKKNIGCYRAETRAFYQNH